MKKTKQQQQQQRMAFPVGPDLTQRILSHSHC